MKKVKFQIKGMHCNSCALLIEERLKDKPGIIKVRVGYDSQKAVIVYDEQKIKESDILGIIQKAGDYLVEKIEEEKEEEKVREEESPREILGEKQFSPNLSLPISIIIGALVISGAIVTSGVIVRNSINISPGQQIAQALPSRDANPSPQPSPQPGVKAEFNITKDNHIRGDSNASLTLVEFSDFECPFCARHYPTLNKILDDYKGKVRLVYKHFPLGFHQNAQKAAEASECAAEQGKFWEYHDKLFENLQSAGYSTENFKQWAKDLGLNSGKFNDCLDSGKFAQKVQDDYQEGLKNSVNGTPATFVNGQLISGALPYESFKQIIDGLLKQ